MKLGILVALASTLGAATTPSAGPAGPDALVHASASCAPAQKPGRIRCRAVIELPLALAAKQRLAWGELRVVASHASVTPLRGRLGPLDAEIRDGARMAWSFSVAAAEVGARAMTLRLLATVVGGGPPRIAERVVEVDVRVAP